jgi:hypothetical protein
MLLSNTYEKSVIPQHYFDKYPQLTRLLDFYYEWQATVDPKTIEANRNIDSVEDAFVEDLVAEMTSNFPLAATADRHLVGRHAKQIFRARGTKAGVEQLFKLFLNVNAEVVYPGDYIFAPSSDNFEQHFQIEVNNHSNIGGAVHSNVRTSSGGSFTIVDVKNLTVGDRRRTVATVTDVLQPINIDDLILGTNATIAGSLVSVAVINPTSYAYIGQPVTIVGNQGGVANGVVSQVVETSSSILINVLNAGGRYTATPEYTASDTVVQVLAANASIVGSVATQTTYTLIPSDAAFKALAGTNVNIVTVDGTNTVTSNVVGTVAAVAPSSVNAGNLIITSAAPSANIVGATWVTQGANTTAITSSISTATGNVIGVRASLDPTLSEVGLANTTNVFYANVPTTIGTPVKVVTYKSPVISVMQLGATMTKLVVATDAKLLAANTQAVIYGGATYRVANIGTIDAISFGFTQLAQQPAFNPFVTVTQPLSYGLPSVVTAVGASVQNFIGGESLVHRSATNASVVTVGVTTGYAVGDIVVSPSVAAPTFLGVIRDITGGVISIGDTTGAVNINDTIVGVRTNFSQLVTAVSTTTPIVTGTGRIQAIAGNVLTIRVTGGSFVNAGIITGAVSTTTTAIGNVTTIESNSGNNFSATIALIDGQHIASAVSVLDCGTGFATNQKVSFVEQQANTVIGTGISKSGAVGVADTSQAIVASGVSQMSKLHDNTYRQKFAYEIVSPISFNQYSDKVKRYVHVSGMKMFGSVAIKATVAIPRTISSSITITA